MAFAGPFHMIEDAKVRVVFEPRLSAAAGEITDIFPQIKSDLESTVGLNNYRNVWDISTIKF